MEKKIVVVHFYDVLAYPPVINLVDCLLANNQYVTLICFNGDSLPGRILNHKRFRLVNLKNLKNENIFDSFKIKKYLVTTGRKLVAKEMEHSDILWTTTDYTVRWLGKMVFKYKHIMQLMELIRYYPIIPKIMKYCKFKYPIQKVAQNAKKVVVPEINRAYIQKTWWNLNSVPSVLPNKPYYFPLEEQVHDDNIQEKIELIKKDKRKKILYSGGMWGDRDFSQLIESMSIIGSEYSLYFMGILPESYKDKFYSMIEGKNNIIYLGLFPAPLHLLLYKYADIGVLPYKAGKFDDITYLSELNALYCAPNKLFEYAGAGLPMIGTDVLGLRMAFEKYNIGVCCSKLSGEELKNGIIYIEHNYLEMKENCRKFYDSVDLDKIVMDVIDI